jgi:hypothetical protein
MTDPDLLRPTAVRSLVKWLTGSSDVGVIKRQSRSAERRTAYIAYLQLDYLVLVKDDEGLWTCRGSGPTAEGMIWLEMRSSELDEGYTQIARLCFPNLDEIKMHCEVLHQLPDGTKIRRWVSNAGIVMTRNRPLAPTNPQFVRDDPSQVELIWSFMEAERHFRLVGSDRVSGIVLQHVETWPKGDF